MLFQRPCSCCHCQMPLVSSRQAAGLLCTPRLGHRCRSRPSRLLTFTDRRHLDELRRWFRLVRETTLRKDEQHHCCGERREEGRQAVASLLRCGQQMRDVGARTIARIQGRVQEDRDEDAVLRVVEDPGHDHSGWYCYNDQEHHLHDYGDGPDLTWKNLAWNKEERQVPQGPQWTDHKAS